MSTQRARLRAHHDLIARLEKENAIAAEVYRGMHAAEIASLEAEVQREEQSARTRAAVSPLAAIGDAAQATAPRPAFVDEEVSAERRASRAALSPLMQAADALRDRQIKERNGQ